MPVNLEPGQYQIDDLIFGKRTPYKVTNFEIMPYGHQAGDYSIPRSDRISFGFDQIQPGPINITMQVLQNSWVGPKPPGNPHLFEGSLAKVKRVWRADDVRYNWGEMKPLYYCGKDGITKEIYGRPRKIQYPRGHERSEAYEVVAEFVRADDLSYSHLETYTKLVAGTPKYIYQTGDAPSWIRVLLKGPISNPVITIGENTFKLNVSLVAGEFAEISGYPWRQRAIDSNGVNLRAYMSGVDYLDRFILPPGRLLPVRWTSDEVNTWVPVLGNQDWQTNINDLNWKNLPNTFNQISGKAVVRFDLFNPYWAEKYLGAGLFGSRAAILYKDKKFNTPQQRMGVNVVEPFWGSSGMVIMSNEAMTNFAILEVSSGFGTANYLRIRSGSGPGTYSSVRAQWQNPRFGGWTETDRIEFGAEPIPGNPTRTRYSAYFNGTEVAFWDDTTGVVSTAATNRSSGFVFDMNANLLSVGTGFREIFCYDTTMQLTPIGDVTVIWKDAYQVIQ